ncbi:MAG: M3 family oligoendopeptidase [Tissierellia bacterium]|nr:M3 family oligoendopeptidase [Tissierellia bacterium]
MKFSELSYNRPDLDKLEQKYTELLMAFSGAGSFEEQHSYFMEMVKLEKDLMTQAVLCNIRYTVNTQDKFYEEENDFWDENSARMAALGHSQVSAILASPYLENFREVYGDHFVDSALLQLKTFKEEIMEDLVEESQWASKYQKLMASVQIPFQGQDRTLSEMGVFLENPDRDVRKSAGEATFGFFSDNLDQFDEIYDQLVRIRHGIAKKLGYENFVQLGYDRMGRTDYNHEDVALYRQGVRDFLVPLVEKIYKEQEKRLGLDKLYYYDLTYEYPTGMPKPQGDSEFIIDQARKMYDELSPETSDFFQMMLDRELMDLLSKKGKAPGGYCTYLENESVPFIFANFNGTIGDVNVLTHEFGHAFQVYSARNIPIPSQRFPGMESAEIHSMGMEFITWPWMENFFGQDTEKFFYSHAAGALSFIPYGVLVDHFQHEVFENPEMTPQERRAKWRELEKIYMPWKDYGGFEYLEEGGFWQKQLHIYGMPFYYIDYTLAQIVALQIFKRSREDRDKLWEDYKKICEVGGSLPFLKILEEGGFESPFDPKVVRDTVDYLEDFLKGFDTSRF